MGIVETEGIVTREIKYGDASRILTVITKEFGKISVLAGGVRANKSGLLAATQLFSHVSFTLFKGREKSLYKINSGEVITPFSAIRESLERMAYASYFCDIANYIVQENAPDTQQLALLLNTMFMLSADKLSYTQIKSVFEFRTLSLQGLMPDLSVCQGCGLEGKTVFLDVHAGCAYCDQCGSKQSAGLIKAGNAVLTAASYISSADSKRIFSFKLPESSLDYLSRLGEYYLEQGLEKHFKTLDYLKKVQALEV